MATSNVLIFDLVHVGSIKLVQLFIIMPWVLHIVAKNECLVLAFMFFNVIQKLIIIIWINNVF